MRNKRYSDAQIMRILKHAGMSLQNDRLKEAPWEGRYGHLSGKQWPLKLLVDRKVGITPACRAFQISESCCRYRTN